MASKRYIDNFNFNLKLNIWTPYILFSISVLSISLIFVILSFINAEVIPRVKIVAPSDKIAPIAQPKKSYPGNRSLDSLYNDAEGNKVNSNGRLVSTINMSTDEHSCSFRITYKGNNDRSVKCTSGCDGDSDNSKFCSQYVYNDILFQQGSLSDALLDREYISNRKTT